jgi:uncharacterized protein (TIGR03382 family)
VPAGTPVAELCDTIDNDCDGFVDEADDGGALVVSCYPGAPTDFRGGFASCQNGTAICTAGTTGACVGYVLPSAELCDATDWDCDGNAYNGFNVGTACDNGQLGVCRRTGVRICSADGAGTTCDAPTVTPGGEICGDMLDNDCDGLTDEDFLEGTITVDRVASGDPTFDMRDCDIIAGDGTGMCTAVVFTVENTGTLPISSGLDVVVSVAGPPTAVLSSGETLPRTVAAGDEDTFTYCWRNEFAYTNARVVVGLDGGCNDLESNPASSPRTNLIICGAEVCDGGDNDGDRSVDEMPEACGGNPTLRCVNDRSVYSCVPTLSGEEEAPSDAAPADEAAPAEDAVPADASPDHEDATPAAVPAAAPAAPAEAADPAASMDPEDDGAAGGCSAASSGGAFFGLAPLALLALRRRRRAA